MSKHPIYEVRHSKNHGQYPWLIIRRPFKGAKTKQTLAAYRHRDTAISVARREAAEEALDHRSGMTQLFIFAKSTQQIVKNGEFTYPSKKDPRRSVG